jgi:hypothetical protein
MDGWEFANLRGLLESSRNGNDEELQNLLKNNSLSAVNADYSCLLILRKYQVNVNGKNRYYVNCPPEGDDEQTEQPKKTKISNKDIHNDFFGNLKYIKKSERYEGKVAYNKKSIKVCFSSGERIAEQIMRAKEQFNGKKIDNVMNQMGLEMLALKNESWLEEN